MDDANKEPLFSRVYEWDKNWSQSSVYIFKTLISSYFNL